MPTKYSYAQSGGRRAKKARRTQGLVLVSHGPGNATYRRSAKEDYYIDASQGRLKKHIAFRLPNPSGGYSIGVPRYSFDPRKGDEFIIQGKKTAVKRVEGDMVHLTRSIDGMSALSVSNLYQVARVPETSRFAPYGVRRNPGGMRHGLGSMYELFYSYGGHGGPYRSLEEARKWAHNLIRGDRHLQWIKIKRYSHRGKGGFGATVDTISRRSENPGGPADEHAARELELFVENDSGLYNQKWKPIQKSLITKMARGVYNHAGAVKLFGYLMESGAKKYAKEHSSQVSDWKYLFSPATRKMAAESFAEFFETEAKLGNYDYLLPEKYKKRNPNPGLALAKRNKWVPAWIVVAPGKRVRGHVRISSKGVKQVKIPRSAAAYLSIQNPKSKSESWAAANSVHLPNGHSVWRRKGGEWVLTGGDVYLTLGHVTKAEAVIKAKAALKRMGISS